MKAFDGNATDRSHRRASIRLTAALAFASLLQVGCKEDRIIWSPDGTRAAIITREGLRLCGVDGKLLTLFAPGVYRAAWLGDSKRLVVARSRGIEKFAALATMLGPKRTKALAADAEMFWQQWQMNTNADFDPPMAPEEMGAVIVYLREHHDAEMRKKLEDNKTDSLKEVLSMEADCHSLAVARVADEGIELGAPLSEGLVEYRDIRASPSGSAVAFVTRLELSPVPDDGLRLFVAPSDGSAPATLVTSRTAAHPDWTPDGRALVYLKANSESAASDDLQLGTLVEREVLDPAGHVQIGEKTRDLASLIFQGRNRVRCLRDGRVVFGAMEFQLPLAGNAGTDHEQLFALDRTKGTPVLTSLIRREMLEKMPGALSDFRVSPDERQILFDAGEDADILTIASGSVEHLALGAFNESKKTSPLPEWRRAGEFVYLKKVGSRNELVLRRGADETVLSRAWPDEMVARLVSE